MLLPFFQFSILYARSIACSLRLAASSAVAFVVSCKCVTARVVELLAILESVEELVQQSFGSIACKIYNKYSHKIKYIII